MEHATQTNMMMKNRPINGDDVETFIHSTSLPKFAKQVVCKIPLKTVKHFLLLASVWKHNITQKKKTFSLPEAKMYKETGRKLRRKSG